MPSSTGVWLLFFIEDREEMNPLELYESGFNVSLRNKAIRIVAQTKWLIPIRPLKIVLNFIWCSYLFQAWGFDSKLALKVDGAVASCLYSGLRECSIVYCVSPLFLVRGSRRRILIKSLSWSPLLVQDLLGGASNYS